MLKYYALFTHFNLNSNQFGLIFPSRLSGTVLGVVQFAQLLGACAPESCLKYFSLSILAHFLCFQAFSYKN